MEGREKIVGRWIGRSLVGLEFGVCCRGEGYCWEREDEDVGKSIVLEGY